MNNTGIPARTQIRNQIPLKGILLWILPLSFLLIFYFYPLGNILVESISRSDTGLLSLITQTFRSEYTRRILSFTLWQATLSTLLTLTIGLPCAYLFARYEFKGKSLLRALTGIAFVMPTLVVAAAFNALLGPQGIINLGLMTLLQLESPPIYFMNTLTAILVAHVFYNTTIVLRIVGDFWSHIDPKLSQAAAVLGANQWQILKRITIPILLPAIASAALLVFIFSFTSFGVILILGGPLFSTIETEIYYQTVSLFNLPVAATLALIQLLFTFILTLSYTRIVNKLSRSLSLRPQQYTQKKLDTWRSRLFAGLIILMLFILIITPLFALAFRSVSTFERTLPAAPGERIGGQNWSGFSLKNYLELNRNPRGSIFFTPPVQTITVSIGYAGATMILALLIGLPAAWSLSRNGESQLNRFLDPLLMLPLGTSAVTLGLGFILALDQPPLDLRSSILLIPLAHALIAFPFVVRSLTPALRSISPRLHHAAAVMGARPHEVIRLIDLPLAARAIIVGAVFAFTISLGEFGATALIARPEYPTIPIAIFRLLSRPGASNYGQALALSTILMVVAGVGMWAIERFRIADIGEF